ncbi:hypothetical protein PspLS_03848 [Pyricularia sp. CBS 133598]|nr:hypothetical protein PspLS_03848 [Pyricularia sp. CBS 133598]
MQGEQGLPLPSSLEEVESLILALYEPGPPETISRIQEVLHRVQKSPEGWQLAQSLLVNSNDTIKFFGALTIIVKLNTESSTLSETDANELLQNLIEWFVRSLRDGSGALVTKKLCSALVTCFIQFPKIWPNCIAHLVHCLYTQRSVPVSEARDDDVDSTVGLLDFVALRAALWFTATLVEETSKTDMNAAKYSQAHNQLITEGRDVACLISRGMDPGFAGTDCTSIQEEAIKCLQPWVMYNQRISSSTDELTIPLRTLLPPVIRCLIVDELYEASIELLTDTLSNYSAFFTSEGFDMLINLFETSWSDNRYQQLIRGDFDFESVQFGMLMIAFADAKVVELQKSTDHRSQRFLAGLKGLLGAAGYAVGEDKVFVPALEFWATFVETMVDTMFSEEAKDSDAWVQHSLGLVMQVVGCCYKKIQFPPAATFSGWDSSERAGFVEARKDVADLLQTVCTIPNASLVSLFVDLLLQALSAQAWAELEAAAFCLSALSDCISDGGEYDELLQKVFSSGLFDLLGQSEKLPVRLRQTGLSLIERFSDYFERHGEFLPGALNLLFGAVGDSMLAGPSAKSICTLCSSCRSHLTGEVATFISSYENIHSSRTIDPVAEEKIVMAIASVIQAISDEETRLQAFRHLYRIVRMDLDRCLQLKAQPERFEMSDPLVARYYAEAQSQSQEVASADRIAGQIAVQSLRYILSMAKGLQAVTEAPVDLDGTSKTASSVSESLPHLQSEMMQMLVQLQAAFPDNGELIESICHVLRAGFSETEPGPFVFPANIISQYLTSQNCSTTPRIGYVVSTACAFTSSLASSSHEEAAKQLTKILPWAIDLLQSLPEPEADTELSQNVIELVNRVAQRQPGVMMQLQPSSLLEFFFIFVLKVLDGRETLPKSAAAEFWTTFLTIRTTDEPIQQAVDSVMTHLGPSLAMSLMRNIGGNAARSELDRLSEPLKKLTAQHVNAKTWLEAALADISFPSSKVSPKEKTLFLKKILSLRGSRQTNQVIREFWLACRGSSFAYAS